MRWSVVCAALVAASSFVGPASATSAEGTQLVERGRAKVKWTRIDVPQGLDEKRISGVLRKLLDKAVKRADFGEVRAVSASVRVIELRTETQGDVLRVSCTLVGKLEGGRSAKSRISFGGDPAQAKELELEVLTMVANGLVTRIAEIARSDAKAKEATGD